MECDPFQRPAIVDCDFTLISGVAQYGMASFGKMNANLISSPGF